MKRGKKGEKTRSSGMFDGANADVVGAAVLAGVLTGTVDLLSLDVVAAGTLILVFTFLLGMKLPRLAWLWALVIGGGVPLVWFFGLSTGYASTNSYTFAYDLAAAFAAIGPAIVGAYFGALTRHVGDHVRDAVRS